MIYGYVRVSSKGQERNGNSLDDQVNTILERYAGADITHEAASGRKEREKFLNLIERLSTGDTLVVTKLDRFCRTTKEGLQYIDTLMNKGVNIHILNMGLIEDTAMGRLIVTNLLAFAEFEASMICERTQAGKAIARLNPDYKEGRKTKTFKDEEFNELLAKVKSKDITGVQAAKELGVTTRHWYRLVQTAVA